MGRALPRHGRRNELYQRALHETDPVRRDVALAAAEAVVVGILTRDINNEYGDPLQDPREARLVSSQIRPEDDPANEAYWTQGGLAVSRAVDVDMGHGWSMTVDPNAGA